MIAGGNSLLRQPVSAWLRVIGRLKPGATIDGVAPRLTGVLRQWIRARLGLSANWLSDVEHLLPKQTIAIVPAGAGVGVMKEQYAQQPAAADGGLRARAADRVRQRREPAAGARVARRTQTAVRMAIGASRAPHRDAGAHREHPARDCRRHRGPARRDGRRAAAAFARVSARRFCPSTPCRRRSCSRSRSACPCHRHCLRRSPRLARDANRSYRRAARIGSIDRRSFVGDPHCPARGPGDAVGRARRRRNDARPQSQQRRESGFRLRRTRSGPGRDQPPACQLHGAAAHGDVPHARRS